MTPLNHWETVTRSDGERPETSVCAVEASSAGLAVELVGGGQMERPDTASYLASPYESIEERLSNAWLDEQHFLAQFTALVS